MKFQKYTFLIILMLSAFAARAFNITGTIVDEFDEPLIRATVRLLATSDSTAVKGVLTNDNGRFTLTDIKDGRYILEASYVGYNPIHRPVRVNGKNLAAGTIKMQENAIALKETTVVGIKTPVKVMEDTVEFNADSYKTQPNAVVEDLLKRLPGVEVDSEGKITHNGKEITKILVDGKEFFSDDPKVASKNLPVNMIEKLQVVDRKSDLARLTGVDDGEDETVINLTVKKGMQNGWFGTVEAGYGTDSRYKGSFNINHFWDGNQITFLGGLNNVNDLNFTDGGAGRFRRFGGNNGISRSNAFGVNFNIGKEEKFRIGGDVMYSNSRRSSTTRQEREYLFADSTSYQNSNRSSIDRGHNVRGDFRIVWNPDSFNTFEFRPNFSLNYSDSESASEALTQSGGAHRADVTRSINRSSSDGNSTEFGARIIYNHKFRSRPGRSFSVFANFRSSNVREKTNTYSWNKFFLVNDSVDLYDQYANDHTWSNTFSTRVSWTEPLGNPAKGNFLTFAYQFQYRWNNADKLTYDHPVTFPDGWDGDPVILPELNLNERLSNQFRNDYMNQDIRVGYKHVSKENTLDVGISLVPQMSKSTDLINSAKNIPERWVWNYAPYLRYKLKMSKTRSLNIDYFGRSSQPSMTQLQPVADESDPLNIVQGNPNLDPTFRHGLRARFSDFEPQRQRAIMAMLMANITQNSIISHTTFDPKTGGRFTTYENVNGVWDARLFTMVSFPIPGNKAFTFNNHLMMSYSSSIGYNNDLKNRSGNFGLNESFGFAWRPDNLELEIRPRYSIQYVTNSVQTTANRTVHNYGGSFNGAWYAPFGLVLQTDLNYTATSGYSAGYDKREWMWNASIAYQFLRNRQATVTLSAYDLLQQRSNIYRTITANYIDDTQYNSLTRYFMASFTYKFNTFAKGEGPADADRWDRGPRGGHPGPPPGGRRRL